MLSGYSDGAVIHWEIDTGDILWQENQNERPINDIAISSDGQIAATVSDEITFLWDLKTGQVIHRLDGHEEFITRAAFSPEGKNLATGGWGDTSDVVIWDVDSGAILRRFEDTSRIEDLEFHPDGTSILFGGFDDGTLTMMDVQSGQVIHEMNAGLDISSGTLRAIAVSPDGQRALSGFENSDMILWDLSSGEILRRYKIPEGAHSITFHPDNQAVLTSGPGGFFKLIDLQTGETLFDFKGHSFDVTDVDFTPDGNYAVSASRDKTIRLWQLGNGHVIKQFATPRERAFEVDLSPDGRTVLSSSADGAVILWDVETGEIIRQLTVDQPIMAATFSPDGTKALIGTGYRLAQKLEPGHVIFWDLQTGEEIHRFEGHPYVVFDVEFSPDGKRAISSGSGPMIILWDLETGQAIRRFDDYFVDIPWPHQSFWDVAFNPDGTSILASFGQGPLFVLDLETGVELDQLDGHIDIGATGIEFTRDGELAISGGWDSQVILWDMQNRQIIRRFTNHVGSVGQVSFSPDERLLLGGSSDGTNSLWDVESGEVIRRYGGGFGIHPVFNADGTKALVGFHDGAMELWRMDTSLEQLLTWTESNRYIPELTCEQRLLYDVEPYCETVD